MGAKTGIEWTDHTFNPFWGCTKVSPGCDHCYAETLSTRWGRKIWGPDAPRRFFGDKHWAEPLKWNKEAEQAGVRRRVFCGSMCDWAEGRPDQAESRARLFDLIGQTPHLDWQLLTKRPGAIRHLVPAQWLIRAPRNVWYGTSVENQEQADRRIPQLLAVPAVVRFLSCEPLLGPVDLGRATPCGYYCDESVGHVDHGFWTPGRAADIHWVITGGESGPGARPCHPDWIRSLRDQCVGALCPYFFKQWGEYKPESWVPRENMKPGLCVGRDGSSVYAQVGHMIGMREPGEVLMERVGKKAAGRLLDGRTWDEFPESPVPA